MMAEWYEYVRIRGTEPTSSTQVFQGIAGGGGSTSDIEPLVTVLTEIRDYLERINAALWGDEAQTDAFSLALWQAQTSAISNENSYLDQLDKLFLDKTKVLNSKQSAVIDFFTEVIEEIVGSYAAKWIAGVLVTAGASTGIIPFVAAAGGFLVEFGIGFAFDALGRLLKEGNKLIAAMKAENEILISLNDEDRTASLYEKREQVMQRHLQQIEIVLKQIQEAENELNKATSLNNLATLENILRDALLKPKLTITGQVETDANGNVVYEGVLDTRLEDLAYNEDSFRVGDVEINTRGRYVKH